LRQIQAARDAGDPKEAARLTRLLDQQKKRRQGAEELAAAEQAVAQDEFNAEDKRADKEVERLDARIGKEEEAAAAKLAAIQQGAKEQAAADKAAIDGAQDAAKAEAERYRKQQEGIQDEIDAIQRAAKEQAKKDAEAITSAQTVYNNQKIINDKLALQIGFITGFAERQDAAAQRTAKAAKDTLDDDTKRLPVARDLAEAMERQAAAAERIRNTPIAPLVPSTGPGPQPRTTPSTPSTPSAPGGNPSNEHLRVAYSPSEALRAWDGIRRGGSVTNG
jgi:hypothetical protein